MFTGVYRLPGFYDPTDTCACSGYQALLPCREGSEDKARLWTYMFSVKVAYRDFTCIPGAADLHGIFRISFIITTRVN